MKKSRYKEEQIIAVLREVDAGGKLQDVVRRLGISEQTYYRWRHLYGGLDVPHLRRRHSDERARQMVEALIAAPGAPAPVPEGATPTGARGDDAGVGAVHCSTV